MGCLGVHFGLTADEADRLRSAPDDETLLEMIGEIEEEGDRSWALDTDKAWDAIHRCLTDGTLSYGSTPLHQVILGEPGLYQGGDYVVNLLTPAQVATVSAAIRGIDESTLRRAYNAIPQSDYDSLLSDEDFAYTWTNFEDLRAFFDKANQAGRSVVFTVDS